MFHLSVYILATVSSKGLSLFIIQRNLAISLNTCCTSCRHGSRYPHESYWVSFLANKETRANRRKFKHEDETQGASKYASCNVISLQSVSRKHQHQYSPPVYLRNTLQWDFRCIIRVSVFLFLRVPVEWSAKHYRRAAVAALSSTTGFHMSRS